MQQLCSTNVVRNLGLSLLALNAQSANAVPVESANLGWIHVEPIDHVQINSSALTARFEAEIRAARYVLEAAKKLEDGWEGPGTLAPKIDAIIVADAFLQTMDYSVRPPEVSIGTDGEVNVSWRTSQSFVDLSFYDGSGGVLYARVGSKKFRNFPTLKSIEQLPNEVAREVAWS
jgi:hypothetical protein